MVPSLWPSWEAKLSATVATKHFTLEVVFWFFWGGWLFLFFFLFFGGGRLFFGFIFGLLAIKDLKPQKKIYLCDCFPPDPSAPVLPPALSLTRALEPKNRFSRDQWKPKWAPRTKKHACFEYCRLKIAAPHALIAVAPESLKVHWRGNKSTRTVVHYRPNLPLLISPIFLVLQHRSLTQALILNPSLWAPKTANHKQNTFRMVQNDWERKFRSK